MPPEKLDIDLNLLVVLEALLRLRSVTKAASELGITQSAVSHALARLREVTGNALLVRTTKGMMPTPRATELHEPIRRALDQIQAALAAKAPFDPKTTRRTFTVTMADLGQFVILPKLCAKLAREAPGIDVLVPPTTGDVARALEDGSLDVAVGVFDPAPAGTMKQILFREKFACVVREAHPDVNKTLSLDQYCELAHVLVAPGGTRGSFVDAALAKMGRERRIAAMVPSFLVAPLIVAETDLVLTVSEKVAEVFAKLADLKTFAPPLPLAGFAMSQIWHERNQDEPAHAWFRAAIAEVCAAIQARRA